MQKLIATLLAIAVAIVIAREEKYLANIQRLTFNGTNAEAYFNNEGTKLIFQGMRDGYKCDQIFSLDLATKEITMLSNGKGRTTCGFYLKDPKKFIYSSTMDSMGPGCPPVADNRYGYVWPIYKTMALYISDTETGEVRPLQNSGAYDAEATVAPDGETIIFTSARDGDLELYSIFENGTNLKRLTYSPGYDGGAFFSHDGKKIVWRANRPKGQQLREYLDLLSLGIVSPTTSPMELFIGNADGSGQRQITNLGGSNFAPNWLPKDEGIIFSSNIRSRRGDVFHLYAVDLNGNNVQQITTEGTFNSFPMFSRDGKYLVWTSNRDAKSRGEMDIYIAEWKGINFEEQGTSEWERIAKIALVGAFGGVSVLITIGVVIWYIIRGRPRSRENDYLIQK